MDAMEKKTLGVTISEKRKEKGMTQADLANLMGVTDKAVSKWERDLSYPDVASFPRLAQALGVSVDELMASTSSSGRKKDVESIVWTAVRGVALAMGIAVTVLSVLDELETEAGLGMLGIAVACISIFSQRQGEMRR